MASVELLDSLLVKSKCKQSLSSASCSSSSSASSCSSSNCPSEEESCCKCPPQLECCTPQYLRLSKLSSAYLLAMMGANLSYAAAIRRDGTEGENSGVGSHVVVARRFVDAARYLNMEHCKEDQVWGWTVNLNTGDLSFLQDMEHVNTEDSRSTLLGTAVESLTLNQRKALKVMNNFYKMTEHAAKCLNYPRTEGVMVQATDKCGQKWLLLVNRQSGRNDGNILDNVGELVVVGAKL